MLFFYAREGDELRDIKIQIEQCDWDTEKKVTGRKTYEPYISIWVEIQVVDVIFFVRTIIECTNA